MSVVTDHTAARGPLAQDHFQSKLSFETDCWDVHYALSQGDPDFVLLDVRTPNLYQHSHVPHSVNVPYGKITPTHMAQWPNDTVFVVYCAGPHCNGADKAALKLAQLNRPVKVMIGGLIGWQDEGFDLSSL